MTRARAFAEAALAAALFGVAAPLCKRLGGEVAPTVQGGLLYLGAGLLLLPVALLPSREAKLERRDALPLALVIVAGGLAGPLLLLAGLRRTSAMSASLLLNLEAVFTALIALLWLREGLHRRGAFALALLVGGAALLALGPGGGPAGLAGSLLVAGACLAWALDNNLTRLLAGKRPAAIACWKGLVAGPLALGVGLALGAPPPSWRAAVATLAVGALGYGASLVLYVRALRSLGAARTAALFAAAPFVGALASVVICRERPPALLPACGVVMAAGVALLVSERHRHRHRHEPALHAHLHHHDEHHQHAHRGDEGPEPHAHLHAHEPLEHEHPHLPDLHHRHRH